MALSLLASNNAKSVLAAGISASATVLTVSSGMGSLFPSPTPGANYFKLTIIDAATKTITEIVHVTSVSGDVMTIIRGQEGTTPRVWSTNDIAANMLTAGTISLLAPLDSPALTGTPTVPTASPGTSTTQAASTAFVRAAITALSLGTASTRDVGTGANQIPDMSSFTSTLNTPGVMRFPGGFKLMWTLGSTDSTGAANISLPASFDNACFGAIAIERNPYAWGAGITSVWAVQYSAITKTSVQALARQVSGGTVSAVSGIGCMLLAWGN